LTWAIITGEYPPQAGGVSDYTRIVAEALVAAGDEVHVWTPAVSGAEHRSDRSRQDLASPRMENLSIVIPVYNEGSNFQHLWKELCSQIKCDFSAYVVYDFDEDDTVPIVTEIIAGGESRQRAVKNQRGRGVVAAIMTGLTLFPKGRC